jgi:hypothetical protein
MKPRQKMSDQVLGTEWSFKNVQESVSIPPHFFKKSSFNLVTASVEPNFASLSAPQGCLHSFALTHSIPLLTQHKATASSMEFLHTECVVNYQTQVQQN